jgi:hypothetical protein
MPAGPRILTFFLYLSDVEEGGETSFPYLDIAIKPKKGEKERVIRKLIAIILLLAADRLVFS